jgi:molecular chaperone IbpA
MNKQLRITTSDLFNNPLFKTGVGFDRLVNDFMENADLFTTAGYPPYNLTRVVGQDQADIYEITLAVAGFKQEDIDITVKENNLTVEGKQPIAVSADGERDESITVQYLHKGIAERNFVRNFRLADYVEIQSAVLRDGLLKITLVRNVPEVAKPKRIEIL